VAIVTRTPDSFYDKGKTFALDQAVAAARTAIVDVADLMDIGVFRSRGAPTWRC
jgi:dihydropteroate synthase